MRVSVNGKTLFAKDGEILADVLLRGGFSHARPCGGRGICGKCKVKVDGKDELACKYIVHSDISVEVSAEGTILSESGAAEEAAVSDIYELVLDIGTTTLVMALVSAKEKKIIKVITENNPQRVFGADVISRIAYSSKHGVKELTDAILSAINGMISRIGARNAEILHIAANTTMLHILLGVDPTPMGTAPYTPVFLDEKILNASNIGIKCVEKVHILPSISAFVGADLVAGLNFVGYPKEKYSLLIDLGTNAEVILFSKNEVIATSAAAGPCFEGANITCGMSASEGAVYAYDNGNIKTVGDKRAVGICGTGLIEIIDALLSDEIIDEGGYMECESFDISDGVYLTRDDVRQYQLAKSAVKSAVLTLMKRKNIGFDDIENMYISGGFAAKINTEKAGRTGLLPTELLSRCTPVGNSSLLGTVRSVFEPRDLSEFTKKAYYVDLSSDPVFAELFVDNMFF